jgi:hypothetical protein
LRVGWVTDACDAVVHIIAEGFDGGALTVFVEVYRRCWQCQL